MINFAKQVLPTEAGISTSFSALVTGRGAMAAPLVQTIAPQGRALVFRTLHWSLKLGILKLASVTPGF
jgi:hypothetical protein